MRIPDDAAREWYRARRRAASRRPATRWRRSSRSRASSSRARTGRRRPRAAEEHFTRVVREGQAPEEVPEVALPDGDPVHLPALLVDASRRRLDERGAPADRPGRRQGRTASRSPSSTCRAAALDGALVQAGKRRFARFASLDRPGAERLLLPFLGCLERGGARKSLHLDERSALGRIGYDLGPNHLRGLWRESEAFFCAGRSGAVFENSTACVYVETSTRRPLAVPGEESTPRRVPSGR